jgi:cystathionine beta-synthase
VGTYKVEGIGYDFIPDVMWTDVVDEWIKTEDGPSFVMARRLIRREGLLVGGSSGSAVWATLQYAKKMKKGQRVLTILPDGVRNYMTKFLDDKWMAENAFPDAALEGRVEDIVARLDRRRRGHRNRRAVVCGCATQHLAAPVMRAACSSAWSPRRT